MKYILILTIILGMNIGSERVYIACEGNFYEGDGSLWTIENNAATSYQYNPVGDLTQSVYVFEDYLFVIANVSSEIHIFNITGYGLDYHHTIFTNGSGPRQMIVHNGQLYFTNWYTQDLKIVNLNTWEIEAEITMPGLPEDLIAYNNHIYISIIMNSDWTDGSDVVVYNPESNSIIETYSVGPGPDQLIELNGEIYISRTFYDENWNAYFGTSKISDDEVQIVNYTSGSICGGGIYKINNSIYRVYDGGIAQINSSLEIIPETRIGDYGNSVYSAEVLDDKIYFGLTDFSSPDEVAVTDLDGNEIARYQVDIFPGDFSLWRCSQDGDINEDENLDITDIVEIVSNILETQLYNCKADINSDNDINIFDVIEIVQLALEGN